MFELVDLILSFVVGMGAAVWIMAFLVRRWVDRLRNMLEEAMAETAEPNSGEDLKQRVEQGSVVLLEVEVENDQYFCYNHRTQQFVCQGRDVSEIIEHFKQRFPGLNAVLHTGDETALKTLRQQLKDHKSNNLEQSS